MRISTGQAIAASVAIGFVGLVSPASAQVPAEFPRQPIKLIVGFPPGGGADTVARIIHMRLGQILGTSVVVDNRTGANGRIGAELVARAAPDGHTLLVSTEGALVTAPHMVAKMPYDPLVDLAPVSLLATTMTMLVALPALPANSLADVIAAAKQKPGKLHYASSGIGGPNHLAGELMKSMAGIDIVHVAYKGTGAALPAVLGGDPQLLFGFVPSVANFVQSKRLKGIAVAGTARSAKLPDVPTMAQAGLPGYQMTSFVGALAPANVPPAVLAKLAAAFAQTIREASVETAIDRAGFDAVGSPPAAFASVLKAEHAKYGRLLATLDIRE